GDMEDLPFFEHFYAGGFGSVRGFERNTLGPRISPQESPFYAPTVWDDVNGDGVPTQNEFANLAYVVCEDPSLGIPLQNGVETICKPGEAITYKQINPYQGRTRGAFGGN